MKKRQIATKITNNHHTICTRVCNTTVFSKLNRLQTTLDDYSNKHAKIALTNKDLIESNILKIKQYGKLIKQGVDNTVNDIVKRVC